MKKSGLLLAIVGGLIGVGIILSFYGNYLLFENLIQDDGDVGLGEDLIIEIELDSTETRTGIYAVQIINVKSATVTAKILDPFDTELESHQLKDELFEGFFDVTTSGTYKLVIENKEEQVKIFGVIGPQPDAWKKSLDDFSIIVLIIGLVGMVGVVIFTVISRKKSIS
ncbi:MAG: hypothetical protein OEM79_04230 [Nitrosopumilus sp.]|nr:hypothetical protein [Nitrosopumilus sp.]